MASVPSLKSISVTKLAVQICVTYFRKEILSEVSKDECQITSWSYLHQHWSHLHGAEKSNWESALEKLNLPKQFQEEVSYQVIPVAKRVYQWCLYQKFTLSLDQKYCATFLNASLFTSEGKINKTRVAKAMVKDTRLNLQQRFKIAGFYMLIEDVYDLWKQMSAEQRSGLKCISGQEGDLANDIIKIWYCHLAERLTESSGNHQNTIGINEIGFWKLAMEKSVEFANDVALKICYDKLYPGGSDSVALTTAVKVLSNLRNFHMSRGGVWNCASKGHFFYPDNFFDILAFFLAQMGEDQKEMFFQDDAKNMSTSGSTLLMCVFDFHCEHDLVHFAKMRWGNLHPKTYAQLLFMIRNHQVFNEFWRESPENYKRYFVSNKESFTNVVLRNKYHILEMFLRETTLDERSKLMFSTATERGALLRFLFSQKYDIAIKFIEDFQLTHAKWHSKLCNELELFANANFMFHIDSPNMMVHLKLFDKCIELCLQSADEMLLENYKSRLVYGRGMETCWHFLQALNWEKLDCFVNWCFSSAEDIIAFKKVLFETYSIRLHLILAELASIKKMDDVFAWFGVNRDVVRAQKVEALGMIVDNWSSIENSRFDVYMIEDCSGGDEICISTMRHCIKENLLWHLEDKELAKQFMKKPLPIMNNHHQSGNSEILNMLNSLIMERMLDFEKAQPQVKNSK